MSEERLRDERGRETGVLVEKDTNVFEWKYINNLVAGGDGGSDEVDARDVDIGI